MSIKFLTKDQILKIHQHQIDKYGGQHGVLKDNELESALYAPQATFDGTYLYTTIPEMAACYLYHLVKNHPFQDGNKRTALAVALMFVRINKVDVTVTAHELELFVWQLAAGEKSKDDAMEFFQKISTAG